MKKKPQSSSSLMELNRVKEGRSKKRRRSKKRLLLFVSISIVFSLIFIEISLRLARPWLGNKYQAESLSGNQKHLARSGRGTNSSREVLHPYFAWTFDPNTDPGVSSGNKHFPINAFGFPDDSNCLVKRKEGRINIAILGGSFSREFSQFAGDELAALLKVDTRFRDQNIDIIRLGMFGYKQPQQLMILNYMMAMGAEYDYVINLDGFNEGVLPATDNIIDGINYSYPRGWHARLYDVVDPRVTSISYRTFRIRAKRQQLAKNTLQSNIKFFFTYQIIWKIRDEFLRQELVELELELQNHRYKNGRQFAAAGPDNTFNTDEEMYESMGDLWKNCSWQMHLLCQGHQTEYLHFLQPNQYVVDSKQFSEEELENAIVGEQHGYRLAVQKGYPVMQQHGKELVQQGVRFIDLTPIYRHELRTLYRDWCCHVNELGYSIVAKEIAKEILSGKNN